MARHEATGEVIIASVSDVAGDPLDATEKARLISDTAAAASAALMTAGFTEAAGSLVVSIEDPAAGPDSLLLWFNYTHDSTAYRVFAPIWTGSVVVAGFKE